MMTFIGGIVPRLILLVAWSNDPGYWQSAIMGSPIWLLFGFLFFPVTTLTYGLASANGMTFLNWIFMLMALLIDLGTWGIGALAARKEVSNFRSNAE